MSNSKFLVGLCAIGLIAQSCQQSPEPEMKSDLVYPDTYKDLESVDTIHGTAVADPYRWLEDDRSEETEAWVTDENKLTFSYLDQIPYRKALTDRLTELWNYEKYSSPTKHGNYYYFYKNDGLQSQAVVYRKETEDAEESELFLDPNKFSADGTTSLAGVSFNKEGNICAYQISEGGSDWRKVIIMDVETMKPIEDTLMDVKFSGISWKGSEGFYYSSYDKPKEGSELSGLTQYHKLFFHKLGTPQSEDQLIFGGEATPRRYIGGYLTEDESFLIISAATSTTGNELYVQDLRVENAPTQTIIDNFDNTHSVISSSGNTLFIKTNLDAPNARIVRVEIEELQTESWVDVIPTTENVLSATTAGGYIMATYLIDATSKVFQFNMAGELIREIELPGVGTASGFGGEMSDSTVYYSFTSYTYPSTTFKYSLKTGESKLYRKSEVKFDPSLYESKQVFYTSKDGTKVPMIITYKKGIEMNGKNPTLLYGYGGFNISLTPSFSTSRILLLENGGVLAVANLRGGGEYGEEWHSAGTKMNKQNVFDDFIAAAKFLIDNKYTSSDYLAIHGGSNGGLLVGAVMTQEPELMKVALPAVGVLDMLRYNKFTAGAGWAYDYGTAEESEEMFKYLLGYSPVHNVKEGVSYPATMVMTGDHDDRVVPAHSFKFAAELQAKHRGANPVLIRIETNAGHGAGKPTNKIIEEAADMYSFMLWNMGITEL